MRKWNNVEKWKSENVESGGFVEVRIVGKWNVEGRGWSVEAWCDVS